MSLGNYAIVRNVKVTPKTAMLAPGDSIESILEGYDWLERDILAWLAYVRTAQLAIAMKSM